MIFAFAEPIVTFMAFRRLGLSSAFFNTAASWLNIKPSEQLYSGGCLTLTVVEVSLYILGLSECLVLLLSLLLSINCCPFSPFSPVDCLGSRSPTADYGK